MTPLVYIMPRGTAQINDVSTWLPPSLDTPWQNVFFEYIKYTVNLKTQFILIERPYQGRIQDLIRGGPDRDRPKTAILGPQFCRILVLGPHFWWSGGARPPEPPPLDPPLHTCIVFLITRRKIILLPITKLRHYGMHRRLMICRCLLL